MNQKRYVLSFGGGVNSVAMMIMLLQRGDPLDEVVFADTGVEIPETYEYVHIARSYLAEFEIPLTTVAKKGRGGDLYETSWRRRVFPSVIWRWSTRDFKVNPIHRYYRSLDADIVQYMGIAYDEIERMKDSRVPYVTNLFPLVDSKVTRAGCVELIRAAGLPIPEKSGCYFCPFNSMSRWKWLDDHHPELFDKAIALEENSKHFPDQRLTDQIFRERDRVTLRELRTRMADSDTDSIGTMVMVGDPCGAECMT